MCAIKDFLNQFRNQNILIAPLNWGLGHASRCLPLIQVLTRNNQVTIASDGLALDWLKLHCPQLNFLELPSYNVGYESSAMWLNMIRQGPGILKAINQEQQTVASWVNDHPTNVIISDHRFGVRHPEIESIFMGHQLTIPHRSRMVRNLISKWQTHHINKFDQCWIPDYIDGDRLSGIMSQQKLRIPKVYIGPLSRFRSDQSLDRITEFDLAVVLSGAEPVRTRFEELLVREIYRLPLKVVFIRGTNQPPSNQFLSYSKNMTVIDLASTDELFERIGTSSVILSRSGYSTIMDLDILGKKAILVPTPGQPEQEYLAQLHNNRWINLDQANVTQDLLAKALRVLSK